MRKKIIACLIIVLLLPVLVGCYDQQIFENTAVIICGGAEKGTGDQILFSVAAADNKDSENDLFVVAEENDLMETAISDLTAATENPLRAGKMQNFLFSEELAKEGILKVKDANRLEVTNRFLADYAIVEGSPLTLLEILQKMGIGSSVYSFLDKILENGAEAGICPNTLRHEFNIDFETEGIDPILPLLSYDEEEESIEIAGTALFNGDRYVAPLSIDESRFLSMMTASTDHLSIKLTGLYSENDHTTMNVVKIKKKLKINVQDQQAIVTMKIKLHSFFDVNDWAEISDDQSDVNSKIEAAIERKCEEVFYKTRNNGCDPFGIGAGLRAYYPSFYRENDPEQIYGNTLLQIDVENMILNHNNP